MQNNVLDYLDETVVRVPEKTAFSNGTDEMTFSGYYKVGRYTFVLEKSLCEKFGKLCSPNITVTYSYTWTDLPKQMRAPLVWHLTRSYTGDAYMVIGAPTTMRGEPVRAID